MNQDMAGPDKAAVLLLSLGAETATEVLRHLGESEVRQVSQALARTRFIDPEALDFVDRDFKESLASGVNLNIDGREFAMTVVNRALADQDSPAAEQRSEILAEIEQTVAGDLGLASILHGVPPTALASILEGEHPQIAALILAHVASATAAETVALLPDVLQADVVERLARLESVSVRLASEVAAVLKERVAGLSKPAESSLGGPKAVAEVLNHADKTVEARIFEEIDKVDPELVEEIRTLMFTFDDCMKLDDRSLQTLLKEVQREDLLLSLKTAAGPLKEKIFRNVSSRAAEILKEDMAAAGPVRLKEVESAQARVIGTLRELEAEGKVVILAGGKDDVLV